MQCATSLTNWHNIRIQLIFLDTISHAQQLLSNRLKQQKIIVGKKDCIIVPRGHYQITLAFSENIFNKR